jgi:hypothetical protein
MNKFLFLILIIVLGLSLPILLNKLLNPSEGFSNYTLDLAEGEFPKSLDTRMLSFYPSTGSLGISNNEAQESWWRYPTFKVGSYDQITNNIRYPNNPDVGTCTPDSMCFALYKNNQVASNYVKPLPPVPDCPGSRVNYYKTQPNMMTFSNLGNIEY